MSSSVHGKTAICSCSMGKGVADVISIGDFFCFVPERSTRDLKNIFLVRYGILVRVVFTSSGI